MDSENVYGLDRLVINLFEIDLQLEVHPCE